MFIVGVAEDVVVPVRFVILLFVRVVVLDAVGLPDAVPVSAPINVVVVSSLVVALYVSPASVAGAREPVAEVPRRGNVVVSPPASATVTVAALPVMFVWSPVFVPERLRSDAIFVSRFASVIALARFESETSPNIAKSTVAIVAFVRVSSPPAFSF